MVSTATAETPLQTVSASHLTARSKSVVTIRAPLGYCPILRASCKTRNIGRTYNNTMTAASTAMVASCTRSAVASAFSVTAPKKPGK